MANKLFDGAITQETSALAIQRAKVLMYGTWKVGKTSAASLLPKAFFIDTENASDWCRNEILSRGGVIKKTSNFDEVNDLVAFLEKNNPGVNDGKPYEFWTLVIDSLTPLYLNLQEKLGGKDGGLSIQQWGKLKSMWKNFMLKILSLDMNVFVTSHESVEYGAEMVRVGTKPDSEKRDPHWFDFIFLLELAIKDDPKSDRMAVCKGQRSPIGKPIFPPRFRWSYESFHQYLLDFFGVDILERTPIVATPATQEQTDKLANLIMILNYPQADVDKWLEKANVDTIMELNADQTQKCIDLLEKLRAKRAKELADGSGKSTTKKDKDESQPEIEM